MLFLIFFARKIVLTFLKRKEKLPFRRLIYCVIRRSILLRCSRASVYWSQGIFPIVSYFKTPFKCLKREYSLTFYVDAIEDNGH